MTGQFVELTKSNIGSFAQLYVDVFNAPPWDVDWSLAAATERLSSFTEFPRFLGLGHTRENKPIAFVKDGFKGKTDHLAFVFQASGDCERARRQAAAVLSRERL